jgi:hypothetical protein
MTTVTTTIELQRSNPMLRLLNHELMAAYIDENLLDRAHLDVRTSFIFYDALGLFEFALADMPNESVLQGFYNNTSVRFWSQGIV